MSHVVGRRCLVAALLIAVLASPSSFGNERLHESDAERGRQPDQHSQFWSDFRPDYIYRDKSIQPKVYSPDCDNPEDNNDGNYCQQKRAADASWVSAKAADSQLLASWAQTIVIFVALIVSALATRAAVKNAEYTRQSVLALQRGNQLQSRAYIHFKGIDFRSFKSIETGEIFWRIWVVWENYGSTPTQNLTINVTYRVLSEKIDANYKFEEFDPICTHTIIPPNSQLSSKGYDIPCFRLNLIKEKTLHLYVYGTAIYRDVFDAANPRVTKFCVYLDSVTNDVCRHFDVAENPVAFNFPYHDKHNCADDECRQQGL